MFFWITAGLVALAVGGSLVLPLVFGRGSGADPDRAGTIYRDQLAEVERDLGRGVIEPDEAERARTEIARRILAADRDGPAVAGEAPMRLSRPAAAAVLLVLVGGAFGIYGLVGSPGQGDLPRAARIEKADAMRESRPSQAVAEAEVAPFVAANRITPPPDIAAAVDGLRAALSENPDDLQGWQMLTDFETRTGNLAAAAAAMGEVVRVKGDAATVADLAGLVDRMVFSAQGYVSPEAEAVLERIAAMAPDDTALLYYTGLLYAQTDRADLAFELWRRVIETGGDSLHARLARDGMADVAWLAGRSYTPPDLPGPSAEDMAAAAEMAPEDREAMIRGMVAQLSDRLAREGGTAEDWARLITSLGVLGETVQAEAIRAEAQGVFAGDPAGLEAIRRAAVQAGLPE